MAGPSSVRERIIAAYGEQGRRWLLDLPRIRRMCAARWSLREGDPYKLSYHLVLRVTRKNGAPAVLKLMPPGTDAYEREVATLTVWGGQGAARLIDAAPELGAMLLEQATPGTPLDALTDDAAATRAAANLMPHLWVTPPPGSPLWAVEHRLAALDEATLPAPLLARARTERDDLLATAAEPVVLHGDLHHVNILRHGAGWKAIDPHGVIGEPCYEVGALLRNPVPHTAHILTHFEARLAILNDVLGFPVERMRRWAFVQAVLAAWWSTEEGDTAGAAHWLRIAGAM